MEKEERFKNIMESALKEGINSVSLMKVIKELQLMIQLDELTVEANSKLKNVDLSFQTMKDAVEKYNEKTLELDSDKSDDKTGLAVSMVKNLFR